MDEFTFSGKYIVKEEIARGGMGVLYRALDKDANRHVAIKVLHSHLSQDTALAQRFLREARAMARLNHPNIIHLYTVEEQETSHYLVMEYCSGTNLQRLLKDQTPALSLATSLDLILQLTDALGYAHEQGIIHRDIKPANILITKEGKPKLTDFGISAAFDEMSLTAPGQILGTPEYMAPEQAKGENMDARTDLYSLGIILYELVANKTPFRDVPQTVILSKLYQAKEELTLEFPMTAPTLVRAVIEDLVRYEINDRTPNTATLAKQLRHILSTLPAPEPITFLQDTSRGTATQNISIPSTTTPEDSTKILEPNELPQSVPTSPALAATEILSKKPPHAIPSPPTQQAEGPPPSIAPLYDTQAFNAPPVLPYWSSSKIALFGGSALAIFMIVGGFLFLFSTPNPNTSNLSVFSSDPPGSKNGPSGPNSGSNSIPPGNGPPITTNKEEKKRLAEEEADRIKEQNEQKLRETERTQIALTQKKRKQEAEKLKKVQARLKKEKRETAIRTAAIRKEQKELDEEKARQRREREQLQTERERLKEKQRLAKEQSERERLQRKRDQLQIRLAEEKTERERIAKKQALLEKRLADEEAERKRLVEEQKNQLRLDQERLEKEAAERHELTEKQKKLEEQLTFEKAERERMENDRKKRDQDALEDAKRKQKEWEQRLAKKPNTQNEQPTRIATAPPTQDNQTELIKDLEKKQLQEFLDTFKTAYEEQNLPKLQELSIMKSGRPEFLDMMFRSYATINLSILLTSMTQEEAKATIQIKKLIDKNGKEVPPRPMIKSMKVQIHREGNRWAKVEW